MAPRCSSSRTASSHSGPLELVAPGLDSWGFTDRDGALFVLALTGEPGSDAGFYSYGKPLQPETAYRDDREPAVDDYGDAVRSLRQQ